MHKLRLWHCNTVYTSFSSFWSISVIFVAYHESIIHCHTVYALSCGIMLTKSLQINPDPRFKWTCAEHPSCQNHYCSNESTVAGLWTSVTSPRNMIYLRCIASQKLLYLLGMHFLSLYRDCNVGLIQSNECSRFLDTWLVVNLLLHYIHYLYT